MQVQASLSPNRSLQEAECLEFEHRLPHFVSQPDILSSCLRMQKRTGCIPVWISRHLTFYRLHVFYFLMLTSIGTSVMWIFPKRNQHRMSLIDAMYNVVSSSCVTGLTSVRMQEFSAIHLALMMILMILGSQIFTSLMPLYVRQNQFSILVQEIRSQRQLQQHAGFRKMHIVIIRQNEEARNFSTSPPHFGDPLHTVLLEYEALMSLSWIVVAYFVGIQVVGFFLVEFYILCTPIALRILKEEDVQHAFFALFGTVASFANSGMVPLDENMVPFRQSSMLLMLFSILILVGNTMFAPCLRAIIAFLHYHAEGRKQMVYGYLLKHPRRCYTHLFPRNQTLWLVVTVMTFNAFDSIFLFILDWNSVGLKGLNFVQKVMIGVFQSITTRSAGENVVRLGDLSPSMLVLYVCMMYIAVYPVFLSRQNTQAQVPEMYKFYKVPLEDANDTDISVQSRRLLARDSAYLFIAIFTICIIENRQIITDPLNYSIFNIMFEVTSAYGNVGLSVGYTCAGISSGVPCEGVPYSFSGKWNALGKVVIVVVMFLGRHRGLPNNIDAALTPPPHLQHHYIQTDEVVMHTGNNEATLQPKEMEHKNEEERGNGKAEELDDKEIHLMDNILSW